MPAETAQCWEARAIEASGIAGTASKLHSSVRPSMFASSHPHRWPITGSNNSTPTVGRKRWNSVVDSSQNASASSPNEQSDYDFFFPPPQVVGFVLALELLLGSMILVPLQRRKWMTTRSSRLPVLSQDRDERTESVLVRATMRTQLHWIGDSRDGKGRGIQCRRQSILRNSLSLIELSTANPRSLGRPCETGLR